MTDFQALINKAIKTLRLKYGLSQEKFSEKIEMNSDNYRNIEHNRHTPKASTIDKICDTFGLTPIELISIGLEPEVKNSYEAVIARIKSLNSKQIDMLNGFIDVIKSSK